MKHFLANSNEDGRDSTSSDFDTRLFHEYYAYPFYKGITEGGSRAFMAAYNSWNGIPMSIHPCLEEITRKQWGNNGIICTDGGALKLLIEAHKSFPSFAEGAAAVVKATTGQFLDAYVPYVKEALEKGLLTEVDIDKAIRGNIFVALKLGLLDGDNSRNPYLSIGKNSTETPPFMTAEARRLAREVTAKSVVLLKNKKLLPLDAGKLRKIAVIGPYSDKIVQDWYSGTPPYETTILSGIRNAVKEGTEIIHAEDNRMGQAEKAAAAADVAIVCVGNHPYGTRADWKFSPVPSDGREAVDRKSLMLPDEDLVKLVLKANPNTILVLVSSFPYTINWSQEHVPAIVHITHCSQEQGNGLADVLFGKVNPAGRTVQTWVKDITDLPDIMDYDIRNGRTYMYHQGPVLYPFGYGLSYSDFAYEKIESFKQDKKNIRVTVSVKNTSERRRRSRTALCQLSGLQSGTSFQAVARLQAYPHQGRRNPESDAYRAQRRARLLERRKADVRCRTRNGEAADRGFIGRYTVGGKDQAIRMKKPSLNIPTIKISELCHNNVANPLITYLQA